MSELSTFSGAARGLAKNPLGVIALFIVLIYGFAALTFATGDAACTAERVPLVWFLVIFPGIVLATFGWLVSRHHEKLYAPSDFKNDDGFLRSIPAREHAHEIRRQNDEMKARVLEILKEQSKDGTAKIEETIEKVVTAIDASTSFQIEMGAVPGVDYAAITFPVAAFDTFGELTDAIYFEMEGAVNAYEYGHSWVLKDRDSGRVIKNARMITGASPGVPLADKRTLAEVGIFPGSRLVVQLLSGGR